MNCEVVQLRCEEHRRAIVRSGECQKEGQPKQEHHDQRGEGQAKNCLREERLGRKAEELHQGLDRMVNGWFLLHNLFY